MAWHGNPISIEAHLDEKIRGPRDGAESAIPGDSITPMERSAESGFDLLKTLRGLCVGQCRLLLGHGDLKCWREGKGYLLFTILTTTGCRRSMASG